MLPELASCRDWNSRGPYVTWVCVLEGPLDSSLARGARENEKRPQPRRYA
jgi:hypothetical protein